jgi:GGDEF domain-containing protein
MAASARFTVVRPPGVQSANGDSIAGASHGKDGTRELVQSAFLAQGALIGNTEEILLCDPLTGLIAYPSFEQYLIRRMPELLLSQVHISIGDVDDLRTYVTSKRYTDPLMFGHIAGNLCMKMIGAIVQSWESEFSAHWPMLVCGTFGGDEVIVAAAGLPYEEFLEQITKLSAAIRLSAPCTCSFASGTLAQQMTQRHGAEKAYQHLISSIDRALFDHKIKCREAGIPSTGDTVTIGCVDVKAS